MFELFSFDILWLKSHILIRDLFLTLKVYFIDQGFNLWFQLNVIHRSMSLIYDFSLKDALNLWYD